MQNLGSLGTINEMLKEENFLTNELNSQALKDFKYLCSKTGYNCLQNVNFINVVDMNKNKSAGDFLVLGNSGGTVVFPKELIDIQKTNLYVAVVAYRNNNVQDVYVFNVSNFAKTGMFSMFKDLKKENAWGIALGSESKLKQYSFGYVLKNI